MHHAFNWELQTLSWVIARRQCWLLTFGSRQAGCGSGLVEENEECDDGNRLGGDGCSDHCRIEPGHPFLVWIVSA